MEPRGIIAVLPSVTIGLVARNDRKHLEKKCHMSLVTKL